MALKFDVSQFDKRSASLLNRKLKEIERLIDEALDQIARSSAGKAIDPEKAFRLEDFPVINRKVKRILKNLGKELVSSIEDGDREQWLVSAEKNDSLVDSLVKGTSIPKETIEAWKQPNLDALQAFQQRKTDGINLSKRVWNITEQVQRDLEMALDIGLGSGLSAADLSREVRKYLKYPDKLFRRVRDKNGNLRLSKNAAAFHPGRGVYRSSYKNALRLAATENNMAYRKADNVRWGQLDFVIGQRIGLSNNHPVADICDDLKGDYPKDFVFTGWHPFCRCHAESILASGKEFDEYQRRILEGEDVTGFRFSGRIAEPPENFRTWVRDNQDRIESARSQPYFIRDNKGMVEGILSDGSKNRGRHSTLAKRIAKQDEQMFTRQQIENLKEIENALSIKRGMAMSFEEANQGKVNPNYKTEKEGYKINCQRCVVAYEMRRRGFNVEACPKLGNGDSLSRPSNRGMAYLDPTTLLKPAGDYIGVEISRTGSVIGKVLSELIDEAGTKMSETGRYQISFSWKEGSGHRVMAERFSDGAFIIYDAQTGDSYRLKEYFSDRYDLIKLLSGIHILRTDNLLINPEYISDIVKGVKAP